MSRPNWNDDPFTQRAKREGYLARSAYKLLEIQEKRRILSRGDVVVDLGCAPGAWLQVAAKIVGPRGRILGVDLQCLERSFGPNVKTIQSDVFEIDGTTLASELGLAPPCFDVVLSDMAPRTGGGGGGAADHFQSIHLCERVLVLCEQALKPGGKLAMKVLEGEGHQELLQEAKRRFSRVKGLKPKASRSRSREMFVVCEGFTCSL